MAIDTGAAAMTVLKPIAAIFLNEKPRARAAADVIARVFPERLMRRGPDRGRMRGERGE